jgi:NAD(P)-dependent dehydrogenase (short-subunit alcohol dehydrogenase family)
MDRRLWVLGGHTGIGAATRERLWSAEPSIFEEVKVYGYEDFDIRLRTPLRRALEEGRPTDVVFSVGTNRLDWIADVGLSDFSRVMETNVYGFLNLVKLLDETGADPVNIVAVTSDAAWRPMRTSAIYCASKAALEMAVRVASREYAPRGWRINAVAPGKVEDTPMTEYVDERVLELRGWTKEFAEEYERQSTPLGRKVTKAEVAEVIQQVLLGPKAQTGEIIAVNGGR